MMFKSAKSLYTAFILTATTMISCISQDEQKLLELPRTPNNIASRFPGINFVADTLKSDTTTAGGFKPDKGKPQPKGPYRGIGYNN